MKNAILISGTARTFVFKEQIENFKRLKQDLKKYSNQEFDFFILLKLPKFITTDIKTFQTGDQYNENFIQSELGIKNLEIQLQNIKPVFCEIFHSCSKFNNNTFYSQYKMISYLLEKAEEYSNKNNFKYNFFIRYRSDYAHTSLKLNLESINKNLLYTSIKKNINASDIFFILSNELYKKWWKNHILKYLENFNDTYNEHFIMKDVSAIQPLNMTNGGLVRDYNLISFWCKEHKNNFDHQLYWASHSDCEYKQLHKTIKDKNKYIDAIKITIKKYNGIYSEYLN